MNTGQDLSVWREFPFCSLLGNTNWNPQARAGNCVFLSVTQGWAVCWDVGGGWAGRVDGTLTGSEDGSEGHWA